MRTGSRQAARPSRENWPSPPTCIPFTSLCSVSFPWHHLRWRTTLSRSAYLGYSPRESDIRLSYGPREAVGLWAKIRAKKHARTRNNLLSYSLIERFQRGSSGSCGVHDLWRTLNGRCPPWVSLLTLIRLNGSYESSTQSLWRQNSDPMFAAEGEHCATTSIVTSDGSWYQNQVVVIFVTYCRLLCFLFVAILYRIE